MKRREFISGVVLGSLAVHRQANAASPCAPALDILDGEAIPIENCDESAFSALAASLSPGDTADFSEGMNGGPAPAWATHQEIQQLTSNAYYDAVRSEVQCMGKPASSQSLDFTHYIYNLASNRWTLTTQSKFNASGNNGHLWNHTFDPATGDYYFIVFQEDVIRRFVRGNWNGGSPSWRTSSPCPNGWLDVGGGESHGGMGWHPNLFGAGIGGIVVRSGYYFVGWRPDTDEWQAISGPYSNGDAAARHDGGGRGIYFASSDTLIVGTGEDDLTPGVFPFYRFKAGSGGKVDKAPVQLATPPVMVRGQSSGGSYGHVAPDPANADHLLLLHRHSPYRVWRSRNQGGSWELVGNHPMNLDSADYWTVASLHGVFWFLASGAGGGGPSSLLWKPDV